MNTKDQMQPDNTVSADIAGLCRELKLPGFFKAFQTQAGEPKFAEMAFPLRLVHMLQAERNARFEKRCARCLKESGIADAMPSLDRLTFEPARGLNRSLVSELALCEWVTCESPLNVIITGPSGTGKTYLAKALGKAVASRGLSVLYIRAAQLIERLQQARRDGEPGQLRHRLNSKRLLIVDDFGMSPMDEETLDDFMSLVEERIGHGALVIASQLSFPRWYDYISSPYHADAFMDRMKNRSYSVELKGRSLRETTPQAIRLHEINSKAAKESPDKERGSKV